MKYSSLALSVADRLVTSRSMLLQGLKQEMRHDLNDEEFEEVMRAAAEGWRTERSYSVSTLPPDDDEEDVRHRTVEL